MRSAFSGFLVAALAVSCAESLPADEDEPAAAATAGSGSGASGGSATTSSGGSGTCAPGSAMECYSGPPGTEGVGICTAGVAECLADGSGFGPCVGEVVPAAEDCATLANEDCGDVQTCGVAHAH